MVNISPAYPKKSLFKRGDKIDVTIGAIVWDGTVLSIRKYGDTRRINVHLDAHDESIDPLTLDFDELELEKLTKAS